MKTESTIKLVTVYTDRAQVTRHTKVKLSKGVQSISFDNLSPQIIEKSVQVSAAKPVVLKDIKFNKEYLPISSDSKRKELVEKIENLQNKLNSHTDMHQLLSDEKVFVQNISNKVISSKQKNTNELNPESWQAMITFYHQKTHDIDSKLREKNIEIKELQASIKQHTKSLKLLGDDQYKENNQVLLSLEVPQEGEYDILLKYVVYNASWTPNYDIRVDSETRKINIAYNALIQQNTGENWMDVRLTLSTAKPYISGNAPSLSQWNIAQRVEKSLASPASYAKRGLKKSKISVKTHNSEREEQLSDMITGAFEIAKPTVSVEQQGGSQVFNIEIPNTIDSDNEKHKVGFTLIQFDAKFEYTCIPKLSKYVYQKALIKNESDFTLIAGEASVFYDGNFISTTQLKTTQPSEEFKLSLGIDEAFTVERKQIEKFHRNEGLFKTKRKKIEYHYQISIKNNKKTKEELLVEDQIPKSQHKDIEVELVEPKIKENSDALSLNISNLIKWKIVVDSAEEEKINLKYSVEYPVDMNIAGLE